MHLSYGDTAAREVSKRTDVANAESTTAWKILAMPGRVNPRSLVE